MPGNIERRWRGCRFCRTKVVESELHVLFECACPELEARRREFYDSIYALRESARGDRQTMTHWEFFAQLVDEEETAELLAELVCVMYVLCDEVPMVEVSSDTQLRETP